MKSVAWMVVEGPMNFWKSPFDRPITAGAWLRLAKYPIVTTGAELPDGGVNGNWISGIVDEFAWVLELVEEELEEVDEEEDEDEVVEEEVVEEELEEVDEEEDEDEVVEEEAAEEELEDEA